MNRRELAKNGFVGLCGALLGKLSKKELVDSTRACAMWVRIGEGVWELNPPGWKSEFSMLVVNCPDDNVGIGNTVSPTDRVALFGCEDGYSLSDGTEIGHGT